MFKQVYRSALKRAVKVQSFPLSANASIPSQAATSLANLSPGRADTADEKLPRSAGTHPAIETEPHHDLNNTTIKRYS
jgi:hypothetical protein